MVRIKRVYDAEVPADGHRVLVDRLWPRGLRKDTAHIEDWLKDLAPSHELRQWFGHDPRRFAEFRRRYQNELEKEPARSQLVHLARRALRETVTLVYGAKDAEHNNAVVLAEEISKQLKSRSRTGARSRANAGGAVRTKRETRSRAASSRA